MTPHQKIFAISVSLAIFVVIIALVRNRKLRAEYAWLWLLTGLVVFVLVVWYDLLVALTALIGAVAPTTTLFIFSIIFLVFISLHFAIKISRLSNQVKNLAQKISLLEAGKERSSGKKTE
ncbi:MAG: DUF2304 domain-containing protein [Deltaproteobacteria bacterium]|nr:DUF2304 domain-containing protein [Deltaproteobacteria bacterium]